MHVKVKAVAEDSKMHNETDEKLLLFTNTSDVDVIMPQYMNNETYGSINTPVQPHLGMFPKHQRSKASKTRHFRQRRNEHRFPTKNTH